MIEFFDLPQNRLALISLFALVILFVFAGVNHFRSPRFYLAIMPPYLPAHQELVVISGIFEILGGVGLLIPATRQWAGYGLILLLIAVFPANIHMAKNADQFTKFGPRWALYLRLPLQFLLIYWIYWTINQ